MYIRRMDFRRVLVAAALLWVGVSPFSSIASTHEVYSIDFDLGGEPAVAQITILGESPLKNPKFVSQVKELHLDHVLMMGDVAEDEGRNPSAEGDYEKLGSEIQKSGTEVDNVKPTKRFLKAATSSLAEVFTNRELLPHREDYKAAIISIIAGRGSYVGMVMAKNHMSLTAGIGLWLAQGAFTFADNAFNFGVRTWLKDNWFKPGIGVEASIGTQIFRGWVYKYLMVEIAKSFEPHWWTGSVQANILAATLITAPLESLISNKIIHAFTGDPKVVRAKVAKLNFWLFTFGSALSTITLVAPKWAGHITNIGAYDLQWSAVVLLGYYGWSLKKLGSNPQMLYELALKIEDGFAWVFGPIARPIAKITNWLFPKKKSKCEITYELKSGEEDPPALPPAQSS